MPKNKKSGFKNISKTSSNKKNEIKKILPILHTETVQKKEALQVYLDSIKVYPLLDPERELDIAKKYFKTKSSKDAQLLILANLRLVVKIAYDFIQTGFHILDLIQEGNIGLLQAVKEFDPYRNVKFASYASYWIKAYIRSFILKNWSLVKIGTTKAQRTLFYRLQKEKAKLEALGKVPNTKYLASKLQVKEKEVTEMTQRLSQKDLSLNAPLGKESDGESWLQWLRDPSLPTDETLAQNQIKEEFIKRLNTFERTLSGKELIIFRERLRTEEPQTLQAIGEIYGITRERVRQIEVRVLEKLKDYMKQNASFKDTIIDI